MSSRPWNALSSQSGDHSASLPHRPGFRCLPQAFWLFGTRRSHLKIHAKDATLPGLLTVSFIMRLPAWCTTYKILECSDGNKVSWCPSADGAVTKSRTCDAEYRLTGVYTAFPNKQGTKVSLGSESYSLRPLKIGCSVHSCSDIRQLGNLNCRVSPDTFLPNKSCFIPIIWLIKLAL